MEVTIQKTQFIAALGPVVGMCERKTTIPILAQVRLDAYPGGMTLAGTDLEVALTAEIDAQDKKSGSITMPARKLLDYVKLLPDQPITLKSGANDWVSITCGKSKTRIAGMNVESFPTIPKAQPKQFSIGMPELSKLIEATTFAISREESRFTMNGALLELEPGTATMVATDGHRLAKCTVPARYEGEKISLLLPVKVLMDLPKALGGEIDISWDDTNIYFATPSRVLMSRKLSGKFPDYSRIMPPAFPHVVTVPRAELLEAVSRVMRFADERSRATRFGLSPLGGLRIHAALSDIGESEESLEVAYTGAEMPTLEIGINGSYMVDVLRALTSESVEIHLRDAATAIEVRVPGGDAYRCVIMPMRV